MKNLSKIIPKILLGIAAVLIAAFGVKNVIDYEIYKNSISSAPFDLVVSINALLLVLPAAVIAASALFMEGKTRALAICAAICAAVSVEEFVRQTIPYQFRFPDTLLMVSPYIAATSIFAIFAIILVGKSGDKKRISKILFGISRAITAGFIIMCIIMTIANKGRDSFQEFFLLAIFLLLPAALLEATALFLRGDTFLLATGAVISALLAILIAFLCEGLPIICLPAVVSALLCALFAVKSKMRGKI